MHNSNLALRVLVACVALLTVARLQAQEGLVAHWKLGEDAQDASGNEHHAKNHGVTFDGKSGLFNGIDTRIEVDSKALKLGNGQFSISTYIYTDEKLDDVLGDIVSNYDPSQRRGFNLSLMNHAGVTSAQSNWRNLFFGIDNNRIDAKWTDCGRPGKNFMIKALCVYKGELYASTWEPQADRAGHVYRYAGGKIWIDCGAPDKSNSVTSMAVYKGKLYVGSELYSGAGSSLPVSQNENHGGSVFRYEGGRKWTNVGKVADVRSVSGLAVFNGKLYAGTGTTGAWRDKPRTRGMYRFDGDGKWTDCGCPGTRIVHLSVHNGNLYGMSYDDGGFFRYEGGTKWTQLGPLPDTTQVYSTAVYQGTLMAGTWPTGSVFRFLGPNKWEHAGRLGEEKEVMGMSVYNGQLYAGTLPYADVYRYDGGDKWTTTGRLDETPDVRYRRAWVMAVFKGKLFCGVLPSGKVLSLEAGKATSYDRELSPGWHHIAAVKDSTRLQIYVDGNLASESGDFDAEQYNLDNDRPLYIGYGQHDYFKGRIAHVHIYNRALKPTEIKSFAK